MLFLSGCAEMPAWIPFQGQRTDSIPGLVTPAQKMAQLKKLRLDAKESSKQQKEQVAAYLTKSISAEPDTLIRSEIIKTLAEYPTPSAEPVFKAALQDDDMDVRVAACEALGRRPSAETTELLIGMLKNDTEKDVRLAAARGLGQSKDQRAIAALGDVLGESDPAMQYRAVVSLKSITGQDLGNNVDRWQQSVKDGSAKPAAEPESLADKWNHLWK
jgi:HEAT repeat protein